MRTKALTENPSIHIPPLSYLVAGASGSGKTHIITQMCKANNINYIVIDCSNSTKAGFKGVNLLDQIASAIKGSHLEENGIIIFDEFCKTSYDGIYDESNVQVNFLKLLDGSTITAEYDRKPVTIDCSKFSFIFAGVFSGIEKIIANRLHTTQIGYGSKKILFEYKNLINHLSLEDIEKFGFSSELCSRIGNCTTIDNLSVNDYKTLISDSEHGVITSFNHLFKTIGVSVVITEDAIDNIAEKCDRNHYGARNAISIIKELLLPELSVCMEDTSISTITISFSEEKQLHCEYIYGERPPVTTNYYKTKYVAQDFYIFSEVDYSDRNAKAVINNIEQLAEDLILTYHNDGCSDTNVFKHFLLCSLLYIYYNLNPHEHTMRSLLRLAECSKQTEFSTTTFDVLLTDFLAYDKFPAIVIDYVKNAYDAYKNEEIYSTGHQNCRILKHLLRNYYSVKIEKL